MTSTQSYRTKNSCHLAYVDKFLVAQEEFLGFYEVPNLKSQTLVRIIKDILLRFQFLEQLCDGQCFNGASNMLGKRSGVAIHIFKEQPLPFPLHPLPLSLFRFEYKGLKIF